MAQFHDATGKDYVPTKWLTYDDVILLPQYSKASSRYDDSISTSTSIGNCVLKNPIISANMDTITGSEMAIKMHELGGLGILHRFYKDDEEYRNVIAEVAKTTGRVAFSIGLNGNQSIEWIEETLNCLQGDVSDIIMCLDVAHADSEHAVKKITDIRTKWPRGGTVKIIVGNIATYRAARMYCSIDVDAIKVGIGNGAVCQTRTVTGHGVPQLSAIMNVRNAVSEMDFYIERPHIIADGGIRSSGDIVKAIAVGADSVMIGSLFAGCTETPGETDADGMKQYRGQSSRIFMEDVGKPARASEGISTMVQGKGSVENVIFDLIGGIRSGLTYSGCANLNELHYKSILAEISNAGIVEGQTHMLHRDGTVFHGE